MRKQFEREKGHSAGKAVSAMCGKNEALLVKEIFSFWKNFAVGNTFNREMEKLRTELAQLKMAQKQGSNKSASLMASNQGSMLARKLLTLWREWTRDSKQERLLEKQRQENPGCVERFVCETYKTG